MTPSSSTFALTRRLAAATLAVGVVTTTGMSPVAAASTTFDRDEVETPGLPQENANAAVRLSAPKPTVPVKELPAEIPISPEQPKDPSPTPSDEPTDEPTEDPEPPSTDGYDPIEPGDHEPPADGEPAPPKDTEHTYPVDNTDPVTVKPVTPPEDYNQTSIGLVDPASGKKTPTVTVRDYGTFTALPDGSITFVPLESFEGSVTIKYFVQNSDGEWVVGWFTVIGGGTTPPDEADSNSTADASADNDGGTNGGNDSSGAADASADKDGAENASGGKSGDNDASTGSNATADASTAEARTDANSNSASNADSDAKNSDTNADAGSGQNAQASGDSDSQGESTPPSEPANSDDKGTDDGETDKNGDSEDPDPSDIADDSNLDNEAPTLPGDVPELPAGPGDDQPDVTAPRDGTTIVSGDNDVPETEPSDEPTGSERTEDVTDTKAEPTTPEANDSPASSTASLGPLAAVIAGIVVLAGAGLYIVARRRRQG